MILLNGDFSKGNISLDSGFFFGKGAFETILVKENPILLGEHIQRLNSGLSTLGVNKIITKAEVYSAIDKLRCKNCVVKIMVSEKNTLITTREVTYKKSDYEEGFSLGLSEVKRNAHSNLTYVKSFNYVENIIERDKIINKGYKEAIFLNTEGFISEGAVSNIFFIAEFYFFYCTINNGTGLISNSLRCRCWCVNSNYSVLLQISALNNSYINNNQQCSNFKSLFVFLTLSSSKKGRHRAESGAC